MDLSEISQMVGFDIQRFAWSKISRQLMDGNSFIFQVTGAEVSRMSQACSRAVSHGYSFKTSFSHEPVTKPKPNQ